MRLTVVVLLAACGRVSFDARAVDGGDSDAIDAPAANAIVEIASGGWNSCARLGSGQIYCWGRGDQGNLGDGTLQPRSTPALVAITGTPRGLEINDGGGCVLVEGGAVECWGRNDVGQLGAGTMGVVPLPQRVAQSDVVELSVGNQNICVRRSSGGVDCAGRSDLVGTNVATNQLTFAPVPGITDAVEIETGDEFGCARHVDGSLTCWGANWEGAFGDGTQNNSVPPVTGAPGPYTALAAGDIHMCGLHADGTVDCWGSSADGQLGDGTFGLRTVPGPVPGIDNAVALACAGHTSCALLATGVVSCWGRNVDGELGDNGSANRATPGLVANLDDVIEISARTGLHLCARRRDATMWCWGENTFGQTGTDATMSKVRTPRQVVVP